MTKTGTKGSRRHLLAVSGIALGLVSMVLPWVALSGLTEPLGVAFDHPERVSYYRQFVSLNILGAVAGLAALLLGGWAMSSRLRYVSAALGAVGLVLCGLFLLTVVGICGRSVLWGYCHP